MKYCLVYKRRERGWSILFDHLVHSFRVVHFQPSVLLKIFLNSPPLFLPTLNKPGASVIQSLYSGNSRRRCPYIAMKNKSKRESIESKPPVRFTCGDFVMTHETLFWCDSCWCIFCLVLVSYDLWIMGKSINIAYTSVLPTLRISSSSNLSNCKQFWIISFDEKNAKI